MTHGRSGEVPRSSLRVRLPCLPLVGATPQGPVQMEREAGGIFLTEQLEQPSDLRDTVAHYVPLFSVALRATTKAA